MNNESYVDAQRNQCLTLKSENPTPLQAYASCLDSKSQFYYTLAFLLLPLVFYFTEFLTLRPEYEPTGLRRRILELWNDLRYTFSHSIRSCLISCTFSNL